MKTLIIVPAFNESKTLPTVMKRLKEEYSKYDFVVINDSSEDDTADICERMQVKVINLPVNLGIGGAVQTGYKYAFYNNYDIAIQFDADGQHNPEYLDEMVEVIKRGYNLCIGSRFINNEGSQSTFMRRLGSGFIQYIIKILTKQSITDPTSGFRACDRKTIKLLMNDYSQDLPEPESIVRMAKNNYYIKEIPVIMNNRLAGKSSITMMKSIYFMIRVTIAIFIAAIIDNGLEGE